ncbi:hypothetical protein [Tsukamurella sp. NPDC003166]|uniref:hypothetical protein n=1 Tax=Tsukamurella sp. NPDC003166 TaxID=3154444 RepID=UPI00339FA13D
MAVTTGQLTGADLTVDTPEMHHARAIVAPIDRDRLIVRLRRSGADQTAIAARIGASQSTVSRVLRDADGVAAAEPTALELIARHVLGQVSHEKLMPELFRRAATQWHEIEAAELAGLVADADYRILAEHAERVSPPPPDDPVVVYDVMREAANRLIAEFAARGRDAPGKWIDRARDVRRRVRAVSVEDLASQKALTAELHRERELLSGE